MVRAAGGGRGRSLRMSSVAAFQPRLAAFDHGYRGRSVKRVAASPHQEANFAGNRSPPSSRPDNLSGRQVRQKNGYPRERRYFLVQMLGRPRASRNRPPCLIRGSSHIAARPPGRDGVNAREGRHRQETRGPQDTISAAARCASAAACSDGFCVWHHGGANLPPIGWPAAIAWSGHRAARTPGSRRRRAHLVMQRGGQQAS